MSLPGALAYEPHQQARIHVEVQLDRGPPGAGSSLDDEDIAIVDRGWRPHALIAEGLLDLRRKREIRLHFGAGRIISCKGKDRDRCGGVGRRRPAGAAVVRRGAVSAVSVDNRGPLTRSFGIHFYWVLFEIVIPLLAPLGDKAGEVGNPLRHAERLDVLVKNLIAEGTLGACWKISSGSRRSDSPYCTARSGITSGRVTPRWQE